MELTELGTVTSRNLLSPILDLVMDAHVAADRMGRTRNGGGGFPVGH